MADHQRKIELQEPDDLRYLLANTRRVAGEKVDVALPPIEGEDVLRGKVEELVNSYVTQTFTLAAPNTLINGHPVPRDSSLLAPAGAAETETVEEYEPFSEALRDRAAKLLRTEEELLLEVGRLRREAPAMAAAAWREELARDGDEEGEEEGGVDGEDGEGVRVERLERQEEVERSWKGGVEGLGGLKREFPAKAARMEKAKRAAEYALAER